MPASRRTAMSLTVTRLPSSVPMAGSRPCSSRIVSAAAGGPSASRRRRSASAAAQRRRRAGPARPPTRGSRRPTRPASSSTVRPSRIRASVSGRCAWASPQQQAVRRRAARRSAASLPSKARPSSSMTTPTFSTPTEPTSASSPDSSVSTGSGRPVRSPRDRVAVAAGTARRRCWGAGPRTAPRPPSAGPPPPQVGRHPDVAVDAQVGPHAVAVRATASTLPIGTPR